jgi:hypothetical protein
LAEVTRDDADCRRRGAAARRYAIEHFSVDAFAARFDSTLRRVTAV